jgi:NitT/TauT family transport system ATP-binding protein
VGQLRVDKIAKQFSIGRGWSAAAKLQVFQNISFTLEDGEFVSLIGPSGCGKTTVLNLVAGLDYPSSGAIYVDEKRVTAPGIDRGVVFQEFALFPWLTVADNIAFGLKSMGIPRAERKQRVADFVELVGLTRFSDYYPNRLSGGMRQRVGLGRALVIDPKVLLMDEPFGSLDAQTRDAMQNALGEIWLRTRKTVLFITHDVREAVYLSDRVLVLSGRPAELVLDFPVKLTRPRDRYDRTFQEIEMILERSVNRDQSR